jgi:helix-turn-helix protein
MLLNPDDPLSEVLTIAQAAALPNVNKSPATLRWWINEGYLTPLRIGRRTYVTERAVLDAQHATYTRTARRARPVT